MSLIKLVVMSFKSLTVKFNVKRKNIHKDSPNFDETIFIVLSYCQKMIGRLYKISMHVII